MHRRLEIRDGLVYIRYFVLVEMHCAYDPHPTVCLLTDRIANGAVFNRSSRATVCVCALRARAAGPRVWILAGSLRTRSLKCFF